MQVPYEGRNCRLWPETNPSDAAERHLAIAVVMEAVALHPQLTAPIRASAPSLGLAESLWLNIRASVNQETAARLRAVIVIDRKQKKAQASWAASALRVARREQMRIWEEAQPGTYLDPVIENSCFGRRVLRRALGLGVDAASGEFNASRLYKNTVSYVWGLSRAMELSKYAVHLDNDWRGPERRPSTHSTCQAGELASRRVQPLPGLPESTSARWLLRACEMLEHTERVSAIMLELPHLQRAAPPDQSYLRSPRFGVVNYGNPPNCDAACTQCEHEFATLRTVPQKGTLWRFAAGFRWVLPLHRAVRLYTSVSKRRFACGYTRPPWLPRQAGMFSNQAYVVHLDRFAAAAWPFPSPHRFNEVLYAEHTDAARADSLLPVFAGKLLGVSKCVLPSNPALRLWPEQIRCRNTTEAALRGGPFVPHSAPQQAPASDAPKQGVSRHVL